VSTQAGADVIGTDKIAHARGGGGDRDADRRMGTTTVVTAGADGGSIGGGGGDTTAGSVVGAYERKARIQVALQKRLNVTSDYDSSDSPTGSEPGDAQGGTSSCGDTFAWTPTDKATGHVTTPTRPAAPTAVSDNTSHVLYFSSSMIDIDTVSICVWRE